MAMPPRVEARDFPFLTTKLYIPPTRRNLVPRPRLIQRLNEGLSLGCKLTLISAPAGSGKTTLITEWLGGVDRPRTWLSLDENDSDPARFFTYLVAALQRIDPSIGQNAQAMLLSPQPPPPESLLTSLINDVAATPDPFVLILDDYHLIQAPPIHQQLTFLVEHQPPSMHLLIATREDPPLPLSRWRAGGQMTDIRQADLKFTEGETADFLRRVMGLELSSADVSALHRRTEGWIVGLQLAALSMQRSNDVRQFVMSFAGSHRYILDYLIEEVFQRQPADLQDFLLKTSILDRLTAPLCDAVADRDDSQQVLVTLEQANLFIVALDESRGWYRYHRLFADLLRQQLRTVGMQDLAPLLHRQASQWYETNGFPADAVHHALAARDWDRAGRFIQDISENILQRGQVNTLLGWMQELPDEIVLASPHLCLDYGWALALADRLDAAEVYLTQAAQAAQATPPLLGQVLTAQAFVARGRGDMRGSVELSQRALALLPADAHESRGLLAMTVGLAHWHRGDFVAAEEAMEEARHAAQASGNTMALVTALTFLGRIQAARGSLRQAEALFRQAIQSGDDKQLLSGADLAHLDLGALCYEWSDMKTANEYIQKGIELSRRRGNAEIQSYGYRALARLKQAQGDVHAAQNALQKAHQMAEEHDIPQLSRDRLAACHVQVALAQSDFAAAAHWAEQMTDDVCVSSFYPLLGLTQARLLLAQDRKEAAAEQLAAQHKNAVRDNLGYAIIEVRMLQALAATSPETGLEFLAEALALAQPNGFVRTFVDAGEALVPLLQEAALQGVMPAYVGKILAAIGEKPRTMPSDSSLLVEPLSEREIEVLRLVAAGLSNREIAKKLIISLGTAKTHIHNIYGKLGVRNRAQAVARAKELDLL